MLATVGVLPSEIHDSGISYLIGLVHSAVVFIGRMAQVRLPQHTKMIATLCGYSEPMSFRTDYLPRVAPSSMALQRSSHLDADQKDAQKNNSTNAM